MDAQIEKRNTTAYRLAKISLTLGIVSIVGPLMVSLLDEIFSYLPLSMLTDWWRVAESILLYLWVVAPFLGLAAVIIGIAALRKMTGKKEGRRFAIIGICLGGLTAIIGLLAVLFFALVIIPVLDSLY